MRRGQGDLFVACFVQGPGISRRIGLLTKHLRLLHRGLQVLASQLAFGPRLPSLARQVALPNVKVRLLLFLPESTLSSHVSQL